MQFSGKEIASCVQGLRFKSLPHKNQTKLKTHLVAANNRSSLGLSLKMSKPTTTWGRLFGGLKIVLSMTFLKIQTSLNK